MSSETANQMQSQIENTVAAPARNYASLVLDYFEQLNSLQLEAAKASAETSLHQARAAQEVKNSADLQGYVENQQKVAKELGERIKSNIEKATSLNQAFARDLQKLMKESVGATSNSAAEASNKSTQAAEKVSKKKDQAKSH